MQLFVKPLKLEVYYIFMASFQIHSGGVQRKDYENCVTVQILMEQSVLA